MRYSVEMLVPDWLVNALNSNEMTEILTFLQQKKFTLRRVIEGVGKLERVSEISISRDYMAKDLMANITEAAELLRNDIIALINSFRPK